MYSESAFSCWTVVVVVVRPVLGLSVQCAFFFPHASKFSEVRKLAGSHRYSSSFTLDTVVIALTANP